MDIFFSPYSITVMLLYYTHYDYLLTYIWIIFFFFVGNNLMSSTASSRSRTRSVGTIYRNGLDSATSSHTSTSSRRECSCSSSNIHQRRSSVNRQSSKQSHSHSNSAKSIEQIHLNKLQSLINGDTKKIKKAPWK